MSEGEPKFEKEKIEEPKRGSGVSRLVGVSPKEEKELLDLARERFLDQSEKKILEGRIDIKKCEREKTSEEIEIINSILNKLSDFVRSYNGVPISIALDHIHILGSGKLDEVERKLVEDSNTAGAHLTVQQFVYIFDTGDSLENAKLIVHELLHFNAFQSFEKAPSIAPDVSIRRAGFEIIHFDKANKEREKPDNIYFEEINEAVIEELTKRFYKKYFSLIPGLKQEIKSITKEEAEEDVYSDGFLYEPEREDLLQVVDDIYEKNPEEFSSKEEVFTVFAEAVMSGKLLKVARFVEKTYGKGSFRELGEGVTFTI